MAASKRSPTHCNDSVPRGYEKHKTSQKAFANEAPSMCVFACKGLACSALPTCRAPQCRSLHFDAKDVDASRLMHPYWSFEDGDPYVGDMDEAGRDQIQYVDPKDAELLRKENVQEQV